MKVLLTKYFINHTVKLEKKLPDLTADLITALKSFNEKTAVSIGKSVFKMRIKSSNLNKGKSGGLRCYIFFYRKINSIVPFCIYLKSQQQNISPDILKIHMQLCMKEIIKNQ